MPILISSGDKVIIVMKLSKHYHSTSNKLIVLILNSKYESKNISLSEYIHGDNGKGWRE